MKRLRYILEQAAQTGHEVVHHISPHDIDKFHPLTHFGTYKAARAVGAYTHRDEFMHELDHNISPKKRDRYHYKARLINKGNTHHLKIDGSMDHTPENMIHYLHRDGVFNQAEKNHHVSALRAITSKHRNDSTEEAKNYAAHAIRSKGVHTISYVNDVEHPGNKSYIITHPNQVHVIKKTKISVRSNHSKDRSKPPVTKV